jgi:organic radical activating enzyme
MTKELDDINPLIMKNDAIYDKANSLNEIRGVQTQRDQVIERLRILLSTIGELAEKDPLRLALRDLFSDEQHGGTSFVLRGHVVEEISRLQDVELVRYLRYRYSYDIYPIEKTVSAYPPLVQIEPASICNYRCIFCYQTDKKLTNKKYGHMGLMDIDLFRELIDQLKGNVEAVTLASRGEPTVNNKLTEMLRYLAGKFLATKVNTNAYLLDDNVSRAILESDIQTLVFSADAASEPLYSQLRVNGSLERVLRNIERFYELQSKEYSKSRTITRVSGVRYSSVVQDLDDMEAYWRRYVDQVTFVDYNPWENVYDAERRVIGQPCSDLWRRLFVWWDGRVCPCDVDYLTTLMDENVRDREIRDIWNGKRYWELRKQHLSGDRNAMEPCSRCVVV